MPATPRIAFPLALLLLAAPVAPAQDRGRATSDIIDDAGMFSRDAVRRAKADLESSDRGRDVVVTVETVESLRGQDVEEVAIRRAEQVGHKGIFVLIAKQERKLEVLASPRSLRDELGRPRLTAITKAFADEFRKGDVDNGLIKGAQAASSALNEIRHLPATIGSGSSSGSSSSLVNRQQSRLTLAGARKALAGAEAAAAREGWKVSIAVVDDGGHLLALDRMDGAAPAGPASAMEKAHSAALHRTPTRSNPEAAGNSSQTFGGIPIAVDGQVIGALGVTGAPGGRGQQDDKIAQAGVEALLAGLNAPAPTPAPTTPAVEEPKPRPAEESKPKPREGERIDITIPRPDEVGRLKPGNDPN